MTTAGTETEGNLATRAGRLSELAERSLRQVDSEAMRSTAEGWIRTRPLTSVLVGATVGFLLGRLLRS